MDKYSAAADRLPLSRTALVDVFGDADPELRELPAPAGGANGLRWLVCVRSGMDAVIPAAGRGSRLGELTADRPKGLVDVAGGPLLAHVFETAVEAGADEVITLIQSPIDRTICAT